MRNCTQKVAPHFFLFCFQKDFLRFFSCLLSLQCQNSLRNHDVDETEGIVNQKLGFIKKETDYAINFILRDDREVGSLTVLRTVFDFRADGILRIIGSLCNLLFQKALQNPFILISQGTDRLLERL